MGKRWYRLTVTEALYYFENVFSDAERELFWRHVDECELALGHPMGGIFIDELSWFVALKRNRNTGLLSLPKEDLFSPEARRLISRKSQVKDETSYSRYSGYIHSSHWKDIRRQRLAMDGFQCSICGTAKNLEVHHLTYERLGHEDLDDLVSLCKRCHAKVHEKDKKEAGGHE